MVSVLLGLQIALVISHMVEVRRALQIRCSSLAQGGVQFSQGTIEQRNAPTIDDQVVVLDKPIVIFVGHPDHIVAEERLPFERERLDKSLLHPPPCRFERFGFASEIVQRHFDLKGRDNCLLRDPVFIAALGELQPQAVVLLDQQLD